MVADLDTLLTALHVELACLAVAQVLLRYDDERRWLRAALRQVDHLFPGCCGKARTTSASRRPRR